MREFTPSKIVYTNANKKFSMVFKTLKEANRARREFMNLKDTRAVITGHALGGLVRYIVTAYQPTYAQLTGLNIK